MIRTLRIIRVIVGLMAAFQLLGLLPVISWFSDLSQVTGQMLFILCIKLVAFFLFSLAFNSLRRKINKMHQDATDDEYLLIPKTMSL